MPTSPSVLLAFAVGRKGSVGSTDAVAVDKVFETKELFSGIGVVVTSLVVLIASLRDDSGTVFATVSAVVALTIPDVIVMVALECLSEVTRPVAVVVVIVGLADDKSSDEELVYTRRDDWTKDVTRDITLVVDDLFDVVKEESTELDLSITVVFDSDNVNKLLLVTTTELNISLALFEELEVNAEGLSAKTVLSADSSPSVFANDTVMATEDTREDDADDAE